MKECFVNSIHCNLFKYPWNFINSHLVMFWFWMFYAGSRKEYLSFSNSAWKFALLMLHHNSCFKNLFLLRWKSAKQSKDSFHEHKLKKKSLWHLCAFNFKTESHTLLKDLNVFSEGAVLKCIPEWNVWVH